jgi:hypothetical protein
LRLHAAGAEHRGIVFCYEQSRSIGQVIASLLLIWEIFEPEQVANRVEFTRRQIGRILSASAPEAWERTGIVGDRGDKTVFQMLSGAIEHVAHHLGFIVGKRRAMGLDVVAADAR